MQTDLESALDRIAAGEPCPFCRAMWVETTDEEGEPEGGLMMRHEDDCAVLAAPRVRILADRSSDWGA